MMEEMDPTKTPALLARIKDSEWWCCKIAEGQTPILLVALFAASIVAAIRIGHLFGYLVGASESPIISTAVPLIFGLLAAVGVGVGSRLTISSARECAMALAGVIGAWLFCAFCFDGLEEGRNVRVQPYMKMSLLLGDSLSKADSESSAMIYAFRSRARKNGISRRDFEPFMVDVIKPILESKDENVRERVARALAIMEGVAPSVTHP